MPGEGARAVTEEVEGADKGGFCWTVLLLFTKLSSNGLLIGDGVFPVLFT